MMKRPFCGKIKVYILVVNKTVRIDRDITLVRDHESDKDAQKVFEKVMVFYLNLRAVDIDTSSCITYITSVQFGMGKWNDTAVSFISHWQDQVRQYNKLVDDQKDTLSPNLMYTMLKQLSLILKN